MLPATSKLRLMSTVKVGTAACANQEPSNELGRLFLGLGQIVHRAVRAVDAPVAEIFLGDVVVAGGETGQAADLAEAAVVEQQADAVAAMQLPPVALANHSRLV